MGPRDCKGGKPQLCTREAKRRAWRKIASLAIATRLRVTALVEKK